MASLARSRVLIHRLSSITSIRRHSSETHQIFPSFSSQILRNPFLVSTDWSTLFTSRRFESSDAQKVADSAYSAEDQALDFPGGNVGITSQMRFLVETNDTRIPCYKVLDDDGVHFGESVKVSEELAIRMYENMVTLQVMDTIFYEAQRQGRISFYLTTIGEEAINIASAAALSMNDLVFPQYREPGVLLWRGFSLQEFANQCFSNKADYGKGRQMPIHYGSNKLNYITVASTVATQLPHAVGAAYSLKLDHKDACAITYFGDGGSSTGKSITIPQESLLARCGCFNEALPLFCRIAKRLVQGDFHAALNFAAVLEVPVIFFCRNNGWAISTPISDQMRSDGVVARGQAYGIRSIRVDGNDALAVYNAVCEARRIAITEKCPILIEALTYRAGHHSTSDDSTKYRPLEEIERWRKARHPITRFRKWIVGNGWWNDQKESVLRNNTRHQVLNAIQVAEKLEKPPVVELFTDVYDGLPSNLQEQETLLSKTIKAHPEEYSSDVPVC